MDMDGSTKGYGGTLIQQQSELEESDMKLDEIFKSLEELYKGYIDTLKQQVENNKSIYEAQVENNKSIYEAQVKLLQECLKRETNRTEALEATLEKERERSDDLQKQLTTQMQNHYVEKSNFNEIFCNTIDPATSSESIGKH